MAPKEMGNQRLRDLFGLFGQRAIVTGGGSGIGRATAQLLGSVGAHVLVADRDEAGAKATVGQIEEQGGKAVYISADVSDEASVVAMFAAATTDLGGVDILVNNAAIFPMYRFTELSVENWDRMHAVNLRGVFLCCREAVKLMREQGKGGSVVNISSVASLRPAMMHNGAYDASKAGVNGLTRSLALDFAADKIRFNAVMPGGVRTPGAAAALERFTPEGPFAQPKRIPLGAAGGPEEIAQAVLFFTSPASAYITGQSLAVDGGFLVG